MEWKAQMMDLAAIEAWNEQLFALINADGTSSPALLSVARLLAEGGPVLAVVLLVVLWVRRGTAVRMAALDATATALLGLGIAQAIARLWYHPRPFEIGLGHQFMAHAPETSFPSDHATLLFGLGLTLVLAPVTQRWGVMVIVLATATAWARVYLGVHFPFDMLGGLAVAAIALGPVVALRSVLHRRLYPFFLRLYGRLLVVFRLPESLFPQNR